MDAILEPTVESVCIRKGTQLGGSEAIYNVLGYIIDQDPAPALVVYPTIELARSVSANRIQSMIEASPALRAKKPSDGDAFTLQEMRFPTMSLFLSGANSPASLASRPCRYVLLDEIDKFPAFAGNEADPISLAEERQKTFWNRKTIKTSTPTTEEGPIMREESRCDEIREYHLPCPHCGGYQILDFHNVKWPQDLDREDPAYPIRVRDSAWYECQHCSGRIEDIHRSAILSAGKWIPRKPMKHPKSVGFVISSLYSPWLRWGDVAEAFVRAKDYPEKLMNFKNSWLAEPWIQRLSASQDEATQQVIKCKAPTPRGIVPDSAEALVIGCDVQQSGIWWRARAFSRDMTSWGIDEGIAGTWHDLEQILFEREWIKQNGDEIQVWRIGIDTGGGKEEGALVSRTEETYEFIRRCQGRGGTLYGTKGSSRSMATKMHIGKPIERMPSGKPIPGGLQIVQINTDAMKEALWWRINTTNEAPGPGAWHLHQDTEEWVCRQITAEEKRRDKSGMIEWFQVRRDNHLLDCEIICLCLVDPEFYGGLRRRRSQQQADSRPRPPAPTAPNPYQKGSAGPTGYNPYTRRW